MGVEISRKQDDTDPDLLPSGKKVEDHIADMDLNFLAGRAIQFIHQSSLSGPFGPRIKALEDAIILLGKEKRRILTESVEGEKAKADKNKSRKPRSDKGKPRKPRSDKDTKVAHPGPDADEEGNKTLEGGPEGPEVQSEGSEEKSQGNTGHDNGMSYQPD